MTARDERARALRRGALVAGLVLSVSALIWVARDRPETAATDRQRDDDTLERAKVSRREGRLVFPSPAPAPPPVAAAERPAAAAPPPLAGVPPKADPRPTPPREIFQPRPSTPRRAVDTGLVFSSRPPTPPEGFVKPVR